MFDKEDDSYEEKEEEQDSWLNRIPPNVKTIGMAGIVLWLFFGYMIYHVTTKQLVTGPLVFLAVMYLLSLGPRNDGGLLTCEESVKALDKHVRFWMKRNPQYKYYKIEPTAEIDEVEGEYKKWRHGVTFIKMDGVARVKEYWEGRTMAYAPAIPRLVYTGKKFGGDETINMKYILPAKLKAAQDVGMLREIFRLGGGL